MDNNLCSICLEEMTGENNIYTLEPCGHKYHTSCALDWFRATSVSSCPNCRDPGALEGTFKSLLSARDRIKAWKQIGRRKSCPVIIKRKLENIRKAQSKFREKSKEFYDFTKDNKLIINEWKKLRREKWVHERKIRSTERDLDSTPVIMLVQELRKTKK